MILLDPLMFQDDGSGKDGGGGLMRLSTPVALIAGSVTIAACSTKMEAHVESFVSRAAAPRVGETVFVIPAGAERAMSLEYQAWVRLAENEFVTRGFRIVPSPGDASLVAVVGLAIDPGRDVAKPFMIPRWGVTGYSGAQTSGTFSQFGNVGTYSGTTTLMPQYGITGYTSGVTSRHVFTRRGILLVFRPPPTPDPVPVFQTRAVSEGGCGLLSAIAPGLVAALFEKFPDGGSGRVTKDIGGDC